MIQGTEYFMSTEVRIALGRRKAYLQSPIDDLESFYHVFVWAILHNVRAQSLLTDDEIDYKRMLSGTLAERNLAQGQFRDGDATRVKGNVVRDLLIAWHKTQSDLREKVRKIENIFQWLTEDGLFEQGVATEREFREWSWHLIAFEGVQRILADIYMTMKKMTVKVKA